MGMVMSAPLSESDMSSIGFRIAAAGFADSSIAARIGIVEMC
jgi:hypothetical protein